MQPSSASWQFNRRLRPLATIGQSPNLPNYQRPFDDLQTERIALLTRAESTLGTIPIPARHPPAAAEFLLHGF
jgi:hypothetical protein